MPPPRAPSGSHHDVEEKETDDDGWVLLTATPAMASAGGKPPRPPPRRGADGHSGGVRPPPFDPSPDDLVGRYLPARRALRCAELPPQIHDADVYGTHHPVFLAKVHPPAARDGRLQWLFFVCRGRGLGGKRRAGRGAYRLVGEAARPRGGACCYYCHSFRYHEDSPAGSAARETEWRMDEYGDDDDRGGSGAAAGAFDMVVCKVYPSRGGALHRSLHLDSAAAGADDDDMKPQVLVQLYLASLRAGDPLRCRMHPTADVCADHPAVLTGVLPPANDQYEWFFAVRRPRTEDHGGGDGVARPRRAGPGHYVPAARYWGVRDGDGREVGYRRVFRYREDDDETRRVSKTEWWMEGYGFGPGFPYGEEEQGNDDEVVV